MTTFLVTGANGKLGRQVVQLLLDAKAGTVIAASRDTSKLADLAAKGAETRRADFDDPATLPAAFAGIGRALLISTDTIGEPGQRLRQQEGAVRALAAAGVRHVVYTSMPRPEGSPVLIAPDHAGTERALHDSALEFTILRNNMYAEMLLQTLPPALASGQLVDARGGGAVAYVTRDDCARVAAAALADRGRHGRATFDITGPAAITSDQLAARLSELAGKPVAHVNVPPAALVDGLVQHGLVRGLAEIFASFDVGIARGDLGQVSDGVQRLSGRAPTPLDDFLQAQRAQLVGR